MDKNKSIPNFQVFNVHAMLEKVYHPAEFWLWAVENDLLSIDKNLMIKLADLEKYNINDHTTFLKKLEKTPMYMFKIGLPKYIVTQTMGNYYYTGETTRQKEILKLIDTVIGKDKVKITRPREFIIQIEVWLYDKDELATLDYYQLINKELFYH